MTIPANENFLLVWEDHWNQQDGATCHQSEKNVEYIIVWFVCNRYNVCTIEIALGYGPGIKHGFNYST